MFEIDCHGIYSCMENAPKIGFQIAIQCVVVLLAAGICLHAIGWASDKALPYLQRFHAHLSKRLS